MRATRSAHPTRSARLAEAACQTLPRTVPSGKHVDGASAWPAVLFRMARLSAPAPSGLKYMNDQTISRRVTVVNDQGLHMRPLDIFVKRATQFDSQIVVIRDTERADGKSILSILTLGAEKGTQLLIEATGQDAEVALAALVELVESGFPEDNSVDT